jgi:hypothetical protein
MQRINFTESTLNTLKRTANCSFANAVYKLTMKAQQGLKCDDLYKKSVLMNDVNKILCNYKLDTCISFHPALEGGTNTWTFGLGNFTGTISYYLNIDGVVVFIGAGNSAANIVTDIINNSDATGVTATLDGSYITITSPVGCFVEEDLTSVKTPSGTIPSTAMVFLASKCAQEETCVDYTEEQLNCISPQDLQILYEFTHKYKETLAKSTKKISNPSSSTNTSDSSDCCTWGSIGGNIGNQSDLVTYLANIEKNYISVDDEGTEITDDVKSINFTGNNVTATNDGNGNVTVNNEIPNLQQVTDVNWTTTNRIQSNDGLGNSTTLNNGIILIQTGNSDFAEINASLVTTNYVAQLPNKLTSPQTFAMLSDINNIQTFKQVISNSDIKNGVIVSLLSAPGVGKAIAMIEASIKLNGNTPYTGAIGVFAIYSSLSGTLSKSLYNSGANTFFTVNSEPNHYKMIDTNTNVGSLSGNIFENEGISAKVFWTTPPTSTGNVGVTVYGSYRIIDL